MISDNNDDRREPKLDAQLAELRKGLEAPPIPPHLQELARRLERALSERTVQNDHPPAPGNL